MSLIALLYFNVWNLLIRKSRTSIFAMLGLFVLLARSSGLEEVHTIYAISGPIIVVAYVFIVSEGVRFFTVWRRSG